MGEWVMDVCVCLYGYMDVCFVAVFVGGRGGVSVCVSVCVYMCVAAVLLVLLVVCVVAVYYPG